MLTAYARIQIFTILKRIFVRCNFRASFRYNGLAVVCNMALLSENNTSPEFYLRLIATLFPRDALGIFWTRCFRRLKSIDRRGNAIQE